MGEFGGESTAISRSNNSAGSSQESADIALRGIQRDQQPCNIRFRARRGKQSAGDSLHDFGRKTVVRGNPSFREQGDRMQLREQAPER